MSTPRRSAILLIGFQNDYFSPDGVMHSVIEENARENDVLANTRSVLDAFLDSETPIINLPIHFSPDYEELGQPTGLLAAIRDAGAFRRDTKGARPSRSSSSTGSGSSTSPGRRASTPSSAPTSTGTFGRQGWTT